MPSRAQTAAVFSGDELKSYLASLNPILWYRLRETDGTTAVNSASPGTHNAANSNATVGQTGKLGANEAYDLNGTTSVLTVANHAAFNTLTRMGIAFLYKLDVAGEGNNGTWFRFGNGVTYLSFGGGTTVLDARIDYTTDARAITNSGQVPDNGQWEWLFLNFDATTDALIHLFRGFGGVVTELTYSTHTAAVGTRATEAADLLFGNRLAGDTTMDGLLDEIILKASPFTAAERQQMTALAGV